MSTEYDTFQLLISCLKQAASASRQIGIIRGDRRWDKVAEMLDKVVENCYDLGVKSVN